MALFFFAGHGLQIDNRGFLIPVDFKTTTISGAFRELVAIQGVISRIEHAAKVSIVMLDACRDSPLHERMRRIAKKKNRALPAVGLPKPSVMGSNTLVVYATVPGEVASDGAGRNSPFTAAFLRHVETPGLDIEMMFKDVTADVLKATNGGQQPERLSRLQTRLELLPGSPSVISRLRKQLAELKAKHSTKQQPSVAGAERKKTKAEAAAHPGKVAVIVRTESGRDKEQWLKPGDGKRESFQDCIDSICDIKGPEMVVVPAGKFMMGSTQSEIDALVKEYRSGWYNNEGSQRKVNISKPFAVGKFAVTWDDWDACVTDGGCDNGPIEKAVGDEGWGKGKRPVINVNWDDAQAYVKWLSGKTGKEYRLLGEAEWEYAARAGTTTRYWWGDDISNGQANYSSIGKSKPVNSYQPNSWGLYQVHGNVSEWCEDVWHENYKGAPTDGSAWLKGDNANLHVARGGAWSNYARDLRSAYRYRDDAVERFSSIGFRIARTL